ncbi:hypothetical protein BASA50_007564 [Batrachochytrium salamandrivorans]|uniref:Mitochondrial glyco protein n=1 Tax=Batrachochytrium salamandrivorans TaxID=1357716 RepID=A0ABQ8FA86_9FUNG|nr:hypothetical protein BASA62_010209 [Batrachochytrium salamandrivorans]KAH6578567.1 hypothetical protein BASA60_003590 [Batrachochytrium salamandrivorans]KAH6593356.1 hypothetical protein BASA50_007564 [Batrachochytrium salamandrivorans]KAH6601181.1 hypothetical protein BASA61_002072 [Batrachochytrium salamandrivorans]KAH9268685.1 hypothetical protein BASA84_000117 [Batrachochytrium salamandrivorans]
MFATRIASSIVRSSAVRLAVRSAVLPRTASMAPVLSSSAAITPMRRFAHGIVSKDLSLKLQEEIKFEESNVGSEDTTFLEEFKARNEWKVEDKLGSKEVTMVRTFGDETITIYFNTDALADAAEQAEGEEGEEDSEDPAVIVSAIIEKKGTEGALEVTATALNGEFLVDHVSYVKTAELARDQSAEGDWVRRGKYGGPVFADLDEGLQETFQHYLEERGFDTDLANFVGLYIESKEQTEYSHWLQCLNKFVSK